ncbi:unnamed protein product [Rotaria sp. Silwood1]|nr:unnamed protein product [Rotaria sp. Silwood1]CAF1690078.1 unnamed protein product [Rotaria sp. Silwood1]
MENRDGILFTTVYQKPSYKPYYLPFNSTHPLHKKKNIPFTMLLRVIRYCSTFQTYLDEREKLRMALLLNKYPISLLNELSCPLPANVDGSVMYLLILYPPIKHSQSGEHLSEQYYSAKSSPSCTHTNILKRRDNDKRTVLHEIPQLTCPTASSIVSFDEIESSL